MSYQNRISCANVTMIIGLLLMLPASNLTVAAQQNISFDGLEAYLNKQMVGPEAVEIIKQHLIEAGTNQPLDHLVAWAQAGFPDLQADGYWKTEPLSLKLGIVRSIHYYFEASPPAGKSKRYLAIVDGLARDDYISYHLVGSAYRFVDEELLEPRVLELLQQKDPALREKGVQMGATLAQKKRYLFDRYNEMLRTDDNAHVRLVVLHSFVGWRTREVAFIALDRLLHDSDVEVRNMGGRGLEIATNFLGVLTVEDLTILLPALLKATDSNARISIGLAAARLSTDRELHVRRNKFTDEFLFGFINNVRAKGTKAGSALTETELAKEWLAWWTPQIPDYTERSKVVH